MFNIFARKKERMRSDTWLFGTMLAFGIIGLGVSLILAIEEFHLLKDPNAQLSCSINVVLNCSVVMKTWQASVFGFPNMFIGLMGFPAVIIAGALGLSRVKLPRWFWLTAHICYTLGALFSYWLFFQSVYVIEVLCPWCLVITFSTSILLSTVTHYTLRENLWHMPHGTHARVKAFLEKDYGKVVTAAWIVLLAALVFLKFGEGLFG